MITKQDINMQKQCKQCKAQFMITQSDIIFYNRISPEFNLKKYQIPNPLLCPDCRQQRRLVWRNERSIYKRKCDFTWRNILSVYSPDKPFKICEQKAWWADTCNWLDYWVDFDFNKPFFEQFKNLQLRVPKMSLLLGEIENSEFTNHCDNLKNCYLVFASTEDKNCIYWNYVNNSKDCIDNLAIKNCELCYECTDCQNGYNLKYCEMSNNCSSSLFLYNCNSCKNCFMCSNLRNKEYCISNKQYSKEEYIDILSKINTWDYYSISNLMKEFIEIKNTSIRKNLFIEKSENVSWDIITNSNNCEACFDVHNSEDCKYVYYWSNIKDSMDIMSWYKTTELCYETASVWSWAYNCKFCYLPWWSSFIMYSINTLYSKYCFWCTDIKNAKYCILNKQYSKEEYEKIVPKIIEHMQKTWEWWEFFPVNLSPFDYNETMAYEYYPVSKEEALNTWWRWKNNNDHNIDTNKIIPANKLSGDIKEIPEDILNWAIKCEITWKPFKLTTQELNFYRKHSLPIPHLHPDERHANRMKLRNPRKLFDRNCEKCNKSIQTTYSSSRSEIVYCEKCYLKEVY